MTEIPMVSALLAAVGLLLAFLQHKLDRDRTSKELFKEFNDRYNKLNDRLSEIVSKFESSDDLRDHPENYKYKQTILDYFNLCAEEYFWYNYKKRIDRVVWETWTCGMKEWMQEQVISDIWDEQKGKEVEMYYGLNLTKLKAKYTTIHSN